MDQIGTMVAEALARRAKAALEQQAKNAQSAQANPQSPQAKAIVALQRRAQVGDKQARAMLAKLQAAGLAPAPSPPPAVAAPAPPAPVQPPSDLAAAAPVADAFELATLPGLPTKILEGMPLERPMLLTAFSRDGLLPAIVFAEALAKPVALREGGGATF